jgi:hypothetical protein
MFLPKVDIEVIEITKSRRAVKWALAFNTRPIGGTVRGILRLTGSNENLVSQLSWRPFEDLRENTGSLHKSNVQSPNIRFFTHQFAIRKQNWFSHILKSTKGNAGKMLGLTMR